MEVLHTLASELIQVPASPTEKQVLENKLCSLSADWDELCQQCVPAGVLPLVTTPTGVGGSLRFQPPSEFEDVSQMIEWLALIESKLQPAVIVVGDFVHLKKLLRDLQNIERELKLREKDYKRFLTGMEESDELCSLLESDKEYSLSDSNTSTVAGTSVPVNFTPSKSVKFNDENTLERRMRHKEIQNQVGGTESGLETPDSDTVSGLHSSPYHSVGPAATTRHHRGAEPQSSHLFKRMSSDPEGSLSRVLKGAGPSPATPMSEEHYQLSLLWRTIWTCLLQQRERLEATQERWKCFEGKKEEFVKFLSRAEERMAFFLRVIANTRNFGVIQTEMVAQKVKFWAEI